MMNRKIAALALVSVFAAPAAFAADVNPTDGRTGGTFWTQPIARITAAAAQAREQFVAAANAPRARAYSFLEDYNP